VPANDEAEAMLRSVKEQAECVATVWSPRSVQQLRLWWGGLMRLLVDNDIFPSKKAASDATKIACGHVETVIMPDDGEIELVPESIAFGSIPQAEFNAIMEEALRVICNRWIGADRGDLLAEIEEMLTPPERKAFGRRVNARALEHAGEMA
jgi:hypothetical protein